jgi:hypothetical protein
MFHKELILKCGCCIYSSNTTINEEINLCKLKIKSILNEIYDKILLKVYTFYISMEWNWPLPCIIFREMRYEIGDKHGTQAEFDSLKCE